MDVSIIIPAFNAQSTLGLTLSALTRQHSVDFEVVIVDDASTDRTSEVAVGFVDRLDLHVHRVSENRGRARARNYGMEKSTGQIILLLDSDIEVDPSYVALHRELHGQQNNVVGIGALRFPPPLTRKALGRYYGSRGPARLKPGQPLPGRYFISGLASFPRSLFNEVGGFNEAFRFYGEDQELGLRFQKAGAHFVYLPEAVGYHHHLRTLPEVVANLEKYGHFGIPIVLKHHPEFASELRLEDLTADVSEYRLKRVFRRLATNSFFYAPLLEFAKLFESCPLPSLLITYLIYCSYRRGFIQQLRSIP